MISFEEFCDGWVEVCQASRSTEEKGTKFEEYFLDKVLVPFISGDCRVEKQNRIRGVDYRFDYLVVMSNSMGHYGIPPQDVIAAFELKSHGFYSRPNIERVKFAFETIEKAWSAIKLFYVTFRETNYYDRKARIIFGKSPKWYYRLSDSGDGVQLPPKSYFPHEWNRMVANLSALKQV